MTTYCGAEEVHFACDVLCRSASASFSVLPSNYGPFKVGVALPAGFFSALSASWQKGEKATVREGGGGADMGTRGGGGTSTGVLLYHTLSLGHNEQASNLKRANPKLVSLQRSDESRLSCSSFASNATKIWSQRFHSNETFPAVQPLSRRQRQVCSPAMLLTDLQTLISD